MESIGCSPATVPVHDQPDPDKQLDAAALHQRIQQAVVNQRKAIHTIALGLAEMKRTRLYQQLGYAGLREYGEQAFGFREGKTWQLARLGEKLPRLPILDHALRTGALGWTKARTVASIATPKTEQKWVDAALRESCRTLEDMAWRALDGADPSKPEDDIEMLQYVWARMRMEALHYELLMRALQKIRKALGNPDLSTSQLLLELAERELGREDPFPAATADAAPTEVADGDQAKPGASSDDNAVVPPRGENAWHSNYRVVEKRCPTCHKAWMDTRAGPIEIERETREMIECDAEVLAGDDSAGKPGHRKSAIPPTVRRLVLARDDARCQVPGCPNHRWLDLHHILPRSKGGTHNAANLVTVCTTHHEALHRNVVAVSRSPDGTLRWRRSHGEALGVILRVDGDVAEIDHSYMSEFDGPPGTWCVLDPEYNRPFSSVEPRARGAGGAEACGEGGTVHGYSGDPPGESGEPPPSRYPRGRLEFRIGDDERAGNIEYRPRLPDG